MKKDIHPEALMSTRPLSIEGTVPHIWERPETTVHLKLLGKNKVATIAEATKDDEEDENEFFEEDENEYGEEFERLWRLLRSRSFVLFDDERNMIGLTPGAL